MATPITRTRSQSQTAQQQAGDGYRVVMLFYRLGRRLCGKQSVADGAALAITVE